MMRRMFSSLLTVLLLGTPAWGSGYGVDGSGVLYEVNTHKKTATRVGQVSILGRDKKRETPILTDLALSQKHGMFGISYSRLYKVDFLAPNRSKRIGALGVPSVNALCFDDKDRLWGAGNNTLYRIDLLTGKATAVGRFGVTGSSDGDLVFHNGQLLITLSTSSGSQLARLNMKTGRAAVVGRIRGAKGKVLQDVWGLIKDRDTVYALTHAGQVYTLNVKNAVVTFAFRTPRVFYYGACPMVRF